MWLILTPKLRVLNELTHIQSILPSLQEVILAKRTGIGGLDLGSNRLLVGIAFLRRCLTIIELVEFAYGVAE